MSALVRALLAGVLIAGLLTALGFGLTRDPRALRSQIVGRQAPPFALTSVDGRRVRLDGGRPRKPMLINFWASWCTECRKEHPALMRAHDEWKDKVDFVGVIYRDSPDNVRRFLVELGETPATTYPNLLDRGSRVAIDYGVYGVPETFFVDAGGRVTFKQVGRVVPRLLAAQLQRIAG